METTPPIVKQTTQKAGVVELKPRQDDTGVAPNTHLGKFFLRLGMVVVVAVLIDFGLGALLSAGFYAQRSGKFHEVQVGIDSTTAPLLLLGSSAVKFQCDSRIFTKKTGFNTYNLGVQGSGVSYHRALLEMVLRRYTPKVVMLNIDVGYLQYNAERESRLKELYPYYNRFPDIIDSTFWAAGEFEPLLIQSKLYRYNSQIGFILYFMAAHKTDFAGYQPQFDHTPHPSPAVVQSLVHSPMLNRFPITKRYEQDLMAIIQLCRQKGIRLVFGTTPGLYAYPRKNPSQMRIIHIADSLGIPYMNYEDEQPEFFLNFPLYNDPNHLNDKGAALFSTLAGERLHGILDSLGVK